jgi:glutaredoxin
MAEFIVYSKDGCTYCERSKTLLELNGRSYQELKLDRDLDRESLLEAIQFFGHGRTMPMIIREDEHGNKERIGGYEELSNYLKENI